MHVAADPQIGTRYRDLEQHFGHWEKIKDCIDQNIDVFENYRQSGHPGGSRSKVHMLVALTLGGFMRWDIRRPEHRFGDRFILVAGHTDADPDHCEVTRALVAVRRLTGRLAPSTKFPDVERPEVSRALDDAERRFLAARDRLVPVTVI